MFLANEELEKTPITDENCCSKFFYEFNMEKLDYFYVYKAIWDSFSTMNYHFDVGGANICIPSGMYVMISDEYGDIDWIPVDEIIGRDIDLLVINSKYSGWEVIRPRLFDSKSDTVFIPNTKGVIPVTDQKHSKFVLVCRTDQYKNTLGLTADAFTTG
jgi:hypothetical protein